VKISKIITSQSIDTITKKVEELEDDGWEVSQISVGSNSGYGALIAVLLQKESFVSDSVSHSEVKTQ
jgi:hypothetical protein